MDLGRDVDLTLGWEVPPEPTPYDDYDDDYNDDHNNYNGNAVTKIKGWYLLDGKHGGGWRIPAESRMYHCKGGGVLFLLPNEEWVFWLARETVIKGESARRLAMKIWREKRVAVEPALLYTLYSPVV